jgi:hypothetical protein
MQGDDFEGYLLNYASFRPIVSRVSMLYIA